MKGEIAVDITPPDSDSSRPTVWVVNYAGHNYHLAEPYGTIRPITVGYVSQGSLDRILFEIVDALKDSKPTDWLLLSGLMILNAVSASVWMQLHGEARMLIWDRKGRNGSGGYRAFTATGEHIAQLAQGHANIGAENHGI